MIPCEFIGERPMFGVEGFVMEELCGKVFQYLPNDLPVYGAEVHAKGIST